MICVALRDIKVEMYRKHEHGQTNTHKRRNGRGQTEADRDVSIDRDVTQKKK